MDIKKNGFEEYRPNRRRLDYLSQPFEFFDECPSKIISLFFPDSQRKYWVIFKDILARDNCLVQLS